MAERTRFTFAGVEFSGFKSGNDRITVPTNALRKILESGRVRCHRNHYYTDDYAGDAANNFGKGMVQPSELVSDLELGKPWICAIDLEQKPVTIRYSPMQSLSYTVYEVVERPLVQHSAGNDEFAYLSAAIGPNWVNDKDYVGLVKRSDLPKDGETKQMVMLSVRDVRFPVSITNVMSTGRIVTIKMVDDKYLQVIEPELSTEESDTSMDINQRIIRAKQCLNRGDLSEARTQFAEVERSFVYGTGKDDLTKQGFSHLLSIISTFETHFLSATANHPEKREQIKGSFYLAENEKE